MKKAVKLFTDVLLLLMLLLALLLYAPHIAGIGTYKILSGSMEPEYPVGSLVYVKKTPAEDINTGDVITFHINENTLVTHRVIEKDSMNNIFNTKGDANEVKDGWQVAYENIVGKVIFSIPYLGIIAGYFNTLNGQYVITAMIIVLFASVFLPDIIKILKKSDIRNNNMKGILDNEESDIR